jgi:type I restriction enzyme S subunit
MSFPRYPTYKPSGVEWLGEVPEHWGVMRLSRKLENMPCYGVLVPEYVDDGVPMLRINDIENGLASRDDLKKISTQLSDEYSRTLLEEGDIALAVVGTIGRSLIVDKQLVGCNLSRAVAKVRPSKDLSSRMLRWIFESLSFKRYTDLLCVGTAQRVLNMSTLASFCVTIPSCQEQVSIATFLDHETAKIDALIAEQQHLIELLQEKRKAVISHAVIKGLNPDAPMKDSGVEWLGEVPEHWVISPIKYLARVGNGSTPNRDNLDYWADDGFPWLNSSVVNKAEVLEAERFVTKLALKECHLPIVEPPAALVGITGQGRTRGMAAQLMFTATVNQHVAFIKPSTNRIKVDYLLRVLEASYDRLRLDSEGSGSTKGAITCEQLGLWSVPLPDHPEQEEIVSFLKGQVEMHESLKTDSERTISLLQERRSALISAAVTGKIDVRGLVPEAEAA